MTIKMSREQVIERLIEDDINTIMEAQSNDYIYNILNEGFIGYNKFSDYHLVKEHEDRFGNMVIELIVKKRRNK
jgi:hypothetical protein